MGSSRDKSVASCYKPSHTSTAPAYRPITMHPARIVRRPSPSCQVNRTAIHIRLHPVNVRPSSPTRPQPGSFPTRSLLPSLFPPILPRVLDPPPVPLPPLLRLSHAVPLGVYIAPRDGVDAAEAHGGAADGAAGGESAAQGGRAPARGEQQVETRPGSAEPGGIDAEAGDVEV